MKKRLLALALIFTLIFALSAPAVTQAASLHTSYYAHTIKTAVYHYSRSGKSKVRGHIANHKTLSVNQYYKGWYKVIWGKRYVWVYKKYVKKGGYVAPKKHTRVIYSSKGWPYKNFNRYMDDKVKSDQSINQQADKLKKKSVSDTALAVTIWVNKNLKYGHPKDGGGAIKAYHQRRGVCTDDSYLTTAMLNHLWIRVRLVSAEPLSNGLMNHVWTEVWIPSKNQWRVYDSQAGVYDWSISDYEGFFFEFEDHRHVIGQWN